MDEKNRQIANHKMFAKGEVVAVTISPPIPKQHFSKPRTGMSLKSCYAERKLNFIREWHPLFRELSLTDYTMYLEISRNGLLHWHGTFTIRDPQVFQHQMGLFKYLYDINIKVDTLNDPEDWKTYVTKDTKIMSVVLTPSTKLKYTITDFLAPDESSVPARSPRSKENPT